MMSVLTTYTTGSGTFTPYYNFSSPKFKTQRHAMLSGFSRGGVKGYTDEEAAEAVGLLDSGFWKRASELRDLGYIEPKMIKGQHLTRKGSSGVSQGVWKITKAGRAQLSKWNRDTI